jgi:hypothetical protein
MRASRQKVMATATATAARNGRDGILLSRTLHPFCTHFIHFIPVLTEVAEEGGNESRSDPQNRVR